MARRVRFWSTTALILVAAATGCSVRSVELPESGTLTPPTFPLRSADPGDDPQLDALVESDTSGLAPPAAAGADILDRVLSRIGEIAPGATAAIRISVYEDSAYITVVDPMNPSVAISANYFPEDDRLNHLGPAPLDADAFPLAVVDPAVPAAVAAGIQRRFPSLAVTSYDLRRGLSYDFGLVWYLEIEDPSGRYAIAFVDPDGDVVAVDLS